MEAGNRLKALAALGPRFPEPTRSEIFAAALAAAATITWEPHRTAALEVLAPRLPEPVLAEALVTARRFQLADERSKALAALAPYVPAALVAQVLEALGDFRNENRFR